MSISKEEIGELYHIALIKTNGDRERARLLVESYLRGYLLGGGN